MPHFIGVVISSTICNSRRSCLRTAFISTSSIPFSANYINHFRNSNWCHNRSRVCSRNLTASQFYCSPLPSLETHTRSLVPKAICAVMTGSALLSLPAASALFSVQALDWAIRQSDLNLTGGILAIVVVWLVLWQQLASQGVVSSTTTRKAIHISCGPAFIALWPLYSDAPSARLVAAIIPLLFVMLLVISGLSKQPNSKWAALGRSISRRGDPSDALGGPLYYTVILLALTIFFFKNVTAAITIMQLCLGDGLAEVIGRRFGSKSQWSAPWTGDKSIAGSVTFAVSGFFASAAAVAWFRHCDMSHLTLDNGYTVLALAVVSVACAAVETAPVSLVGDDNVAIAVVGVFLSSLFFGNNVL